jgi:hypothetical protein
MANTDKDQLLNKLQQRFEAYEGEDPSEAAWVDFNQAYTRSKNARNYYKLLTILLATLMVVAVTIWGLGSSQSSEQTSPKTPANSTTGSKQVSTQIENRAPAKNTTPLATNTRNQQPIEAAQLEETKVSRSTNQTIIKQVSQPAVQPSSISEEYLTPANPSQTVSNPGTKTETVVYQPQVKPANEINRLSHSNKIGVSTRELPFVSFVADSTHPKPPHHKTSWYLDISYLATQSFIPVQAYPSDRVLNGFSIGMGYPLSQKFTLNLGYQYGKMQQTYLAYIPQTNQETKIISIDTSLYYSYDAKKIMMQIDTLSQTKSVTSQTSVTLSKTYTWNAIPLTLSYAIGKPHRMVFVAGGLTSIRVTEEQTNLLTNGTEQQYTQTKNLYVFAPTLGVGVYQKIYKQLGVHVSGNYLYYLPNSLTQRNSLQLQSGIRIQF